MEILKQWVIDNEMEEAADLITLQNLRQIQRANNFAFDDKINGTEIVDNGFTNKSLSERIAQKFNKTIEENECFRDVLSLFSPENKGSLVNMLDASAKIPPGIFYGNVFSMGNYDQCLNVTGKIAGKYCTVALEIKNFSDFSDILRFSYGICLPSRCNALNLNNFLKSMRKTLQLPFEVKINDNLCSTKLQEVTFSGPNKLAMCIFGFFALLLLCGTICDVFVPNDTKSVPLQMFLAFSVYSNCKSLFKTKINKDAESFGCLNGIRVLCMFWIIGGHLLRYFLGLPLTNIAEFDFEWHDIILLAGEMAVDTFFNISGFLVVYLYLTKKNKLNISFVQMYIHRYLRLTPSLAMVIFLYFNISKFGSGPIWGYTKKLEDECVKNWWFNLIYVQNYFREQNCVLYTWYLAVDMHMFLLSPIILIGLIKYHKTTLFGLGMAVLSSSLYSGWLTHQLPPMTYLKDEDLFTFFIPTHFRGVSWIIGAIFGYVMYRRKNEKLKLSQTLVNFLWILSCGGLIAIIFYHKYLANIVKYNIKNVHNIIANSCIRPIWSILQCVVIWLCIEGKGGFVNRFLSAPCFSVLVKVNYSMYLVHIPIITIFYLQIRSPQTYTFMTLVGNFCFDISTFSIFFLF
ncbi:unnamed protein product [Brassicogethes aeneus]|uniref:Nose resistant-to-fluoxetine protein N-terminal domain-containing protein n=1 Tax=Brassicogethes aeneus TaxID=1431903 RepID=A0A9P0FK44_BRAAE|nr:unnamed protein product [Brassicogethes aeneus]